MTGLVFCYLFNPGVFEFLMIAGVKPFLRLNKTEGELLFRISQNFTPPPEGALVHFCVQTEDCTSEGLVSEASDISTFIDSF